MNSKELATEIDIMRQNPALSDREKKLLRAAASWMFYQIELGECITTARGDLQKLSDNLKRFNRVHGNGIDTAPPAPLPAPPESPSAQGFWARMREYWAR